jgi:tetratricopeptide (TPR) repeat protein
VHSRRPFLLRIIPFLCAACCAAGCSYRTESPGQLSVQVRELSRTPIDTEAQKASDALYYYLVGELAYQEEDFGEALTAFSKASALTHEPAASLNSKLAELYVRAGKVEKAGEAVEKSLAQEPDNEKDLFLYAGVLETLGRSGEAEVVYKKLIAKNESGLEAYLLLAGMYSKQGQYDKSIEVLQRLAKIPAYEVLALYQIGHVYEKKLDFDSAAKYYLQVYARSGKGSNVVADILRVYLQAGSIDKARDFSRQVLERDPKNVTASRVLNSLVSDQESFSAAVAQLQELRTRAKDPNDSRFKIALMQIEKQNFDEALQELNLILAANPGNCEARFYLASIYAATGRNKDAVAEMMKIPAGDPIFVRSRTFAAFVLMQDGHVEEAESAAREAWGAERANRRVFYYLVSILRDAQKKDEALDLLAEEVEANPKDAELLFQYGVALHDLKREKEAVEAIERVLQIDPGYSDALNYIAYSLAEEGRDLARALGLVQKALESKPQDAYYTDTLGWIYFKMGDFERAEQELGKAARASGKDIVILAHYGEVLEHRGKFKAAMEVYRLIGEIGGEKEGKKQRDQEELDAISRASGRFRELAREHPESQPEERRAK